MFSFIERLMRTSSNRHSRNALAMLFMTLRLNLTYEVIVLLLKISQEAVSDSMQSAVKILIKYFVPTLDSRISQENRCNSTYNNRPAVIVYERKIYGRKIRS